jgi:hypothetical protein
MMRRQADWECRRLSAAADVTKRRGSMIEVNPPTRRAIWGLVAVILAAGWVAYGILDGGQVFLVVMVVLSILLGGAALFLVRTRK